MPMINRELDADVDGSGAEEPGEEGLTMEALLAQQAAVADKLAERKVAWVKVISVTKDEVLVDVGEKSEGAVPLAEFVGGDAAAKVPAPGQRVPVLKVGARGGRLQLSHLKAKAELGWELAVKARAERQRVRGRVISAVKGGFLVEVSGVTAFLPASLADLRPVREPKRMVGTGVRCYILELDQAKRQLVLSRKAVLEEEAAKRRGRVLEGLGVGEARVGRVTRAGAEGLRVDVGGLEGLVRPQDMAWGKPDPAAFARGQKLKVKILAKPEKEGDPVLLGIKQLLRNPADELRKRFAPKAVVSGRITEVGAHGVRFQVDAKVAAFAPAAECDADVVYKLGETVKALVLGVDGQTFELRVSARRFNEIHERKRVAQYMKAPPPLTLGQLLAPEGGDEA